MKNYKRIKFARVLYGLSKSIEGLSKRLTPDLQDCMVKPIEKGENGPRKSFRAREGFKLVEKENFTSFSLALDKRATRDIIWAYKHRKNIRPGMEEEGRMIKEYSETWHTFERPYQNTVIVGIHEDDGLVHKYIISSCKEELLQSHCDGLEGNILLYGGKIK